ncbi:hypothetical protein WJX72_006871 [[Myrmecia] bisecta]|uniref:Peptidylprolyl isomerase n=1 Tax=[Myrmecia] bisecta TaxID=41462 RepID=A0AAW1R898_9CHLO
MYGPDKQPVSQRQAVAALGACFLLAGCALASRENAFIGYSETTGKTVILDTEYGQIPIRLLTSAAPEISAMVLTVAGKNVCLDCRFYRNEAVPKAGDGPPYGLLQGSLAALPAVPPQENRIVARRGHVCMIPETKEFFIAAKDHTDWGASHSVWGEVQDMAAVTTILNQPFHQITHPQYGTVMRMLDTEVPFRISLKGAKSSDQYVLVDA